MAKARDPLGRVGPDVPGECLEALRMVGDESIVDPALDDQYVRDRVEEGKIGFGLDREMLGRRDGGLGFVGCVVDQLRHQSNSCM